MVTMADRVFIDTNILLRAYHAQFPEHTRARQYFDALLDKNIEIWISWQVIREYLVQVTSPKTFEIPYALSVIVNQIETIRQVCYVADDIETVTKNLMDLLVHRSTLGKQVHDANIVATMLAFDIPVLVTLNLKDFIRFSYKIDLQTLPD